MFEKWGRRWECSWGYAVVDPEGWWFGMWDVTDGLGDELVLFARWPDGGELSVAQYRAGLAPEIVAWFSDEARIAIAPLPPEPEESTDDGV